LTPPRIGIGGWVVLRSDGKSLSEFASGAMTAMGQKQTSHATGSMSAVGRIPDVSNGRAGRQILTLAV
jgi:hypothetical protein